MGGHVARTEERCRTQWREDKLLPALFLIHCSSSRTNDPGHYFCDAAVSAVMTNKFNLGGHQCFIADRGASAGSWKSRKAENIKIIRKHSLTKYGFHLEATQMLIGNLSLSPRWFDTRSYLAWSWTNGSEKPLNILNVQFSHLLNNVGIHNDKKRYVYKDN